MDGDNYNSPISLFPLPPSFPSLLPIPFPEIYYSHSVIYFLQTRRKRPLPVLTELASSQGFNDWGLVQWREEKPGAQLEYTPHPRGSRTDDSYTHYPHTIHTTYHLLHVIPLIPLLLSMSFPFHLVLLLQFLPLLSSFDSLPHPYADFPLFLGLFLPLPLVSLFPSTLSLSAFLLVSPPPLPPITPFFSPFSLPLL